MTRMILHTEMALNHVRDTLQGPQLCVKARGTGPCQQDLFQFRFLLLAQPGWTPWVGFAPQRINASFIDRLLPPQHRPRRDANDSGYFSNAHAFRQQLCGYPTSHFQFCCTAFRSHGCSIPENTSL